MITGKTISELELLTNVTGDSVLPVELSGVTYHIQFQSITDKISSQGLNTLSQGSYSHAEGIQTNSIGDYSHSEGIQTSSLGDYSHSEGSGTISVGQSSHSEGSATLSQGVASHSEGYLTNSISNFSHSEGFSTNSGWRGFYILETVGKIVTIDTGGIDYTDFFQSGKVVLDTNTYDYSSTTFSGSIFTITLDTSLDNATSTEISYSPIDPTGFGIIFSGRTDDELIPVDLPTDFDVSFLGLPYTSIYVSSNGYATFGGGSANCCFNLPTQIPTSVGFPGIFLSTFSTDCVLFTLSSGYTNSGETFVIRFEGTNRLNPAPPESPDLIYNYVFYNNNPQIIDFVIESNPTMIDGSGISDGINPQFLTKFEGAGNTSFRLSTNTRTYTSVADLSDLNNSLATVYNSPYSHSEGIVSKALGEGSHAEGYNTLSIGIASHSEGLGTISSGDYQHVSGKFNTKGNTTSLYVIGNGTGDTSRSDIFLVDTTGVTINGTLTVTGDIIGVRKYVAILNQSGLTAPVATELENTLGTTLTWSYNGVGSYYAQLGSGNFDVTKTFINITSGYYSTPYTIFGGVYDSNSTYLYFESQDLAGAPVDIDGTAFVEISVYP